MKLLKYSITEIFNLCVIYCVLICLINAVLRNDNFSVLVWAFGLAVEVNFTIDRYRNFKRFGLTEFYQISIGNYLIV